MTTNSLQSLTTHYMFRDLEPAVLERVVALVKRRRFTDGEVIFLKGDDGDGLYCVLSGQVRISSANPAGRELILIVMETGDVFGEIALLDGLPRTADATAIRDCELAYLPRQAFLTLLAQEPKLTPHLLTLLCERIRRTSEQMEDSTLLPVPNQLAKRLLILANTRGKATQDGTLIHLPRLQSALADMLGVSRVCINTHLQQWRRQGWISLGRGQLLILDRQALQALVAEA